MIKRQIENEIKEVMAGYPIAVVTGPRQSGKTTLTRDLFSDRPYVNFENPLTRQQFDADPIGFLNRFPDGAVFDEAQYLPDLFSFLQERVDNDQRMGMYVLTGSQHFGLMEQVSQSLAGRAGLLELLPFSLRELQQGNAQPDSLNELLFRGGYPAVYDRKLRPERWYADYTTTYIQRDVRSLRQIHDLDRFMLFLKMCAGHAGEMVNTNKWGAACGVDNKTIKSWLSVLRAAYIIDLVQPYHSNFNKRIVKTPKLYFLDTGLACHLLGIEKSAQLTTHPQRGALFENWVFSELAKAFSNTGRPRQIYFWRTHAGHEVDFIIEVNGEQVAVEVKSGEMVRPEFVKSLLKWNDLSEVPVQNLLVYGGTESFEMKGVHAVPWRDVSSTLFQIVDEGSR